MSSAEQERTEALSEVDEDEWLERHGLEPRGRALDEVRALLVEQTRLERRAQGDGYTPLMRLCCVQLFNGGQLDDALLVWRAKSASFDASISIDVQLLCGAGLAETKEYLSGLGTEESEAALRRILVCEEAGDFELPCGEVRAEIKEYLAGLRTEEGEAALRRILLCEEAGDFEDFSPAAQSALYAAHYA